MPLAHRTIEPIYLGRRPLREEDTGEDRVQVAVTHNCVLGALVQLASLVRHADDLFCDLADECQAVFERSERIIQRVRRVKEGVGRLDSKSVAIPVGDLKRFSSVQDHHEAKHGFDCTLFTPDSRPHCVKARYSLCDVTPVGALRGADPYRKDGLRSSNLFKLWPIVLKEHEVRSPDLSLHRKQCPAVTFSKRYKRLKPRPKTVHSVDSHDLEEAAKNIANSDSASIHLAGDAKIRSPSMSQSQPSILVAVDTSGTGFQRMTSFRQSLKGSGGFPKGTASLDRKSRRRRTVSGVPDNIMQEIELFERGKRSIRSTPRNYSFDDLDAQRAVENQQANEEAMMQYIDELDAKLEEKAETERASHESRILKFLPCRRSRSLPRCVKMDQQGTGQLKGVMAFEQEEKRNIKDKSVIATAASGYHSSSLSLGSAGGSSTSSKATRRSSISNKIKSFVGTLRPRPKSLDLDAIDVLGNDADVEDDSSVSTALGGKPPLQRKLSPSMPDDISSLSSSRESKVGPGTYYYFTSSTLPRAQARKYDFPWESLPKDWTTAVKLREISKRRKDERNSSSGNWSGSSNRQSYDSARSSNLPPSVSQHSLSRDSGRGSPTQHDDKGENLGEKCGMVRTETGTSTFQPAITITTTCGSVDSETEQWLASLAKRAAEREDAAGAAESLTFLSELTKQNIKALEDTFSPASTLRPLRLDDEVSSVHSLDCEGFYTSFHTDSGLRRSTGTLLDGGEDEEQALRESQSSFSLGSTATIDSVIFRPKCQSPAGQASSSRRSGSKSRPPPPVRSCSRLSSASLGELQNKAKSTAEDVTINDKSKFLQDCAEAVSMKEENLSYLRSESSQSDQSDQETIYARLKAKTKISSRSIPSWCLVSDEDSTDSSNACLSSTNPQCAASISVSGSNNEDSVAAQVSSPKTDAKGEGDDIEGESGHDGPWDINTLPHRYLDSKVWDEEAADQSNSWPRSRRSSTQQPTAGILKRDKSPAGTLKPKTLNFAPLVSLFDQHTPQGIELPLHKVSSSSSLDWSSDSSVSGLSYKLSQAPTQSIVDSNCQIPIIRIKHGQDIAMKSNSPQPEEKLEHSSVNSVQSLREPGSDRSVSSSESSLPSLSDCGQGKYRDMSGPLSHRSADSWSSASGSSAALSDIDSSLTYVTSSNSSTPTNSTLALNSDDLPTPVNSPQTTKRHEYGEGLTVDLASTSACPQLGPILLAPSAASRSGSRGRRNNRGRHSLGSFAADASTEAAPLSWVEERLNARTLSGDSGFSSPTSPTNGVDSQHSHCHNHQHRPNSLGRLSQAQNIQNSDVFYENSSSSEAECKGRNPVPSVQPSHNNRHAAMKSSHTADGVMKPPAPRSDSYRAATMEALMMLEKPAKQNLENLNFRESRHVRRSLDSTAGLKTRPQTASQMSAKPSSSETASRTHMPKSKSCPSGVVADADIVNRADSYRLAVRNTQGLIGDLPTRNTSYRMATGEDDPACDSRMDAVNAWETRGKEPSSRDIRRRGITDIDQLKCYDSDSSSSRASASSQGGKGSSSSSSSRSFAGINSSRKKMTPEVQNLLRGDKTPSPEVRRLSKSSDKAAKEKDKSRRSSTYIRFDPIFEQGDDMYASSNTLRAESVEMITSENGFLMSDKIVGQLPPGRVRGTSAGRKHADDKAGVSSILDSIKTTFKSMSGKSSVADKDMWRYEGGI